MLIRQYPAGRIPRVVFHSGFPAFITATTNFSRQNPFMAASATRPAFFIQFSSDFDRKGSNMNGEPNVFANSTFYSQKHPKNLILEREKWMQASKDLVKQQQYPRTTKKQFWIDLQLRSLRKFVSFSS